MEYNDKIVEFDKYCKTCQFKDLEKNTNGDEPEPCNECLTECVNEYSKKPTMYKADEKLVDAELNNTTSGQV